MFDIGLTVPEWEERWVDPAAPPAWELDRWAQLDAAADQRALRAALDRRASGAEVWDLLGRLPETIDARADLGPNAFGADDSATLAADTVAADTVAPSTLAPDTVAVDRMRAWARVAAYAQAQVMTQIAALHDTRDPAPTYTTDDDLAHAEFVAVEVGLALRLGPVAASTLVHNAVRVVADLPATHAALAAGRIDQATATAISEETERLSPEHRAVVEAHALAKADTTSGTAYRVRLFTRRQGDLVDPVAAAERAADAHEQIGVHPGPVGDGVAGLDVRLTVLDRAAVMTALNTHADLARAVPGETRTRAQLRAAVLVDLITRPWLHPGDPHGQHTGAPTEAFTVDPTRDRHGNPLPTQSNGRPACTHGGRWKVDVVVNLSTLLGADDDPADLVGHGLIDAATARLIAADATWRRLVTDPLTGTVVERSTHRYRPPPSMIDAVEARDQHCQSPGCRRPAHHCDLDHRTPHNQGGPTCPCNLWNLCRYHHRCKHSPGWHYHRHHDGTVTVTTPTGHHYTSPPPRPWD